MNKRLVRIGGAVMTTILVLVVIWQIRLVVVYLLISLLLAAAMRPLVTRLEGRGIFVRLAWILLYLVVLGSFGFLLFLTIDLSINELQLLSQSLSAWDKWILPGWLEGSSFQLSLIGRLPPPSKLLEAFTGDKGQLVLPTILGFTQGFGSVVSGILIIFILSIYWSINQTHFERLWLSLLPSSLRKKARGVWSVIEPDIGAYLRGEVIQSLMTGVLLGLGYWLMGSPYSAFLALAGLIASLIPVVGIFLVVIPVLFIGLLTSLQLGVISTLFTLVVFIGLEIWFKSRLNKRRLDSPILTVVLLITLADAIGFIGLVVAPIISVVIQILWSRLIIRSSASGSTARISDLKERQAHLRNSIEAMNEPPLPLVASSMERLASLIEKAEPILQAVQPDIVPEPLLLVPSQTGQE
jgi:predicted PurR-regulated permease PerM